MEGGGIEALYLNTSTSEWDSCFWISCVSFRSTLGHLPLTEWPRSSPLVISRSFISSSFIDRSSCLLDLGHTETHTHTHTHTHAHKIHSDCRRSKPQLEVPINCSSTGVHRDPSAPLGETIRTDLSHGLINWCAWCHPERSSCRAPRATSTFRSTRSTWKDARCIALNAGPCTKHANRLSVPFYCRVEVLWYDD